MWPKQWCESTFAMFIILASSLYQQTTCISNSNFNASLRDYSIKEESNTTAVRTLQKDDGVHYDHYVSARHPVAFKELPDSVHSGSSHSRGVSHHEYPVYASHDYDEGIHYGHGGYEHHPHELGHGGHDGHLDFHGYDHHDHGHYGHHAGHHIDHGHHHHKHYDHGISKAILLPVAGLALLGAAAALVTNPVLLQLGVVSGRKRRDTKNEENRISSNPDVNINNWTLSDNNSVAGGKGTPDNGRKKKITIHHRRVENKNALLKPLPLKQSIETVALDEQRNRDRRSDQRFIPVPLKLKNT